MDFINGKVYVMTTQNDNIIADPIIIDDRSTFKHTIDLEDENKENYLLKFYDGRNTLAAFKTLISFDLFKTVVIFVENLEVFYKSFAIVMDYDFIYVDKEKLVKDSSKRYIRVVRKIRKNSKKKTICIDRDADRRGAEISFCPDILASVQSSLETPQLYLTDSKCPPSLIFLALKEGPKTFTELSLLNIKGIQRHIKSLIFCSIIEKKGEYYKISLKAI